MAPGFLLFAEASPTGMAATNGQPVTWREPRSRGEPVGPGAPGAPARPGVGPPVGGPCDTRELTSPIVTPWSGRDRTRMGSPARRPPCFEMRRYRPGRPAPANAAGNRGFPIRIPTVAGDSGLADLEDRRPDRPPLADERGAEIEAARREVLAEHARAEAPGTPWPSTTRGPRPRRRRRPCPAHRGRTGPAWSSPSRLTPRSRTSPSIGAFQMAVRTGRSPSVTVRTRPTLTDTSRAGGSWSVRFITLPSSPSSGRRRRAARGTGGSRPRSPRSCPRPRSGRCRAGSAPRSAGRAGRPRHPPE